MVVRLPAPEVETAGSSRALLQRWLTIVCPHIACPVLPSSSCQRPAATWGVAAAANGCSTISELSAASVDEPAASASEAEVQDLMEIINESHAVNML
jgi:hypothetical protein